MQTALHFASSGYAKEVWILIGYDLYGICINVLSKVEDKLKQENDLMLTIFELVKNGANPTIKSTSGQQPKHLALTVGFELGIVLIGKTGY